MNRESKIIALMCLLIGGLMLAGCATPLNKKAENQLSRKDYPAAIASYQEHLAKNAGDMQARGQLGVAYFMNGDTQRAIAEFHLVLDQIPDDPQASLHLGLALLQAGKRAEAMSVWRGYRNRNQPTLYREIKRQLTLLEMVDGRELAKKALASEQQLQTQKPMPGTLAVTPYSDSPPDVKLRPVQKGLAAMIMTDLAAIKALKVVERLRTQALIDEMKLGMSGLVDEKTAPRFGRLVGVEHLVAGTMASNIQQLRVSSVLASTLRKDMVDSFGVEGEMAKFFVVEKEIVSQIVKTLNLSPTPAEKAVVDRQHTKNLKAFICYGQGLDSLDSGNWKQAREFFSCAEREDPQFVLAIEALNSCPADTTPPLSSLLSMSSAQFSESVRSAVEAAVARQTSADAEKAAELAASEKGGGGDGGGGGGGGH